MARRGRDEIYPAEGEEIWILDYLRTPVTSMESKGCEGILTFVL